MIIPLILLLFEPKVVLRQASVVVWYNQSRTSLRDNMENNLIVFLTMQRNKKRNKALTDALETYAEKLYPVLYMYMYCTAAYTVSSCTLTLHHLPPPILSQQLRP